MSRWEPWRPFNSATRSGALGKPGAVYLIRLVTDHESPDMLEALAHRHKIADPDRIVYIGETTQYCHERLKGKDHIAKTEQFLYELRCAPPSIRFHFEYAFGQLDEESSWCAQNRLLQAYERRFGRSPRLNVAPPGKTGRDSAADWYEAIDGIHNGGEVADCLVTKKMTIGERVNRLSSIAKKVRATKRLYRGQWHIESFGGRYFVARCEQDGGIYRLVGQSIEHTANGLALPRIDIQLYRAFPEAGQWSHANVFRYGNAYSYVPISAQQRAATESEFVALVLEITGLTPGEWQSKWWVNYEILIPQTKARYSVLRDPFGTCP